MAGENTGAASAKVEGHNAVFTVLRQLLKPYENELAIRTDKPGNCYLETKSSSFNGRHMFFAGAKIKKNYVSFYLPALYMFPDLSDRISPSLRKMMQGQACFNFTSSNADWFEELGRLTQAGYQKMKSEMLL
ncbi:MAG TPA: hypothetical protein VFF11_10485 [Candidatus Binatia bacterium]|nr:hypothetical protein [Candidatus Binatia bacterium]